MGIKPSHGGPFPASATPGPGAYEVGGDALLSSRGTPGLHLPIGLPPKDMIVPSELLIQSAISSSGTSQHGKTHYSSAPIISMGGRGWVEAEKNKEAGLEWDMKKHSWVTITPGPAAYLPSAPSVSRVPTMGTRDALEAEKRLVEGQKLQVRERDAGDAGDAGRILVSEWVSKDTPAPGDYRPVVTNDGRREGAQGYAAFSLLQRLPERQRGLQDESPGPGAYNIPSDFDPAPVGGAPKGMFVLGERPSHKDRELEPRPAPGQYDVLAYDGIGTDKVSIGAASRSEKGISSTQMVREVSLGLRPPDAKVCGLVESLRECCCCCCFFADAAYTLGGWYGATFET